jgi:UDP-N-acetylglucosamine 2-epimerase (non-hydrolysing)
MAPVLRSMRAYESDIETQLVLTGQHTTLVEEVLKAFSLTPDHDLGIMTEGQSVSDIIGRSINGLDHVISVFSPEIVLVQGDTASVFAASISAFLGGVKVGHVEAGLRSHNKEAPFPEEVLRRITDVVADLHFAPTSSAVASLGREGIQRDTIHLTGNTVVDALLSVDALNRPIQSSELRTVIADKDARLVLLTAHRRESFGQPLQDIFSAVRQLVDREEDLHVIYPVHPNPNVSGPAIQALSAHPRIHLIKPLSYTDLIAVLKAAVLVLTDSGGIQEEAPTFGTHVLVLRNVTERPEGIEAGAAELVGTDQAMILDRSLAALAASVTSKRINPYGDGRAGERIADIVHSELTGRPRRTEDWIP